VQVSVAGKYCTVY